MPLIIALFLVAIVALAIVGFVLHLIFSPWLLVVAIGILAWVKLRRRRPRL
jgi:ABC-type iron transport system FetAB permease component